MWKSGGGSDWKKRSWKQLKDKFLQTAIRSYGWHSFSLTIRKIKMNNWLRTLIAGYAGWKWGGGCLGFLVVFGIVYFLLGHVHCWNFFAVRLLYSCIIQFLYWFRFIWQVSISPLSNTSTICNTTIDIAKSVTYLMKDWPTDFGATLDPSLHSE